MISDEIETYFYYIIRKCVYNKSKINKRNEQTIVDEQMTHM